MDISSSRPSLSIAPGGYFQKPPTSCFPSYVSGSDSFPTATSGSSVMAAESFPSYPSVVSLSATTAAQQLPLPLPLPLPQPDLFAHGPTAAVTPSYWPEILLRNGYPSNSFSLPDSSRPAIPDEVVNLQQPLQDGGLPSPISQSPWASTPERTSGLEEPWTPGVYYHQPPPQQSTGSTYYPQMSKPAYRPFSRPSAGSWYDQRTPGSGPTQGETGWFGLQPDGVSAHDRGFGLAVLAEAGANTEYLPPNAPVSTVTTTLESTISLSKASRARPCRPRNKWTEEETSALLRGVADFGIGNWKKILDSSPGVFRNRTAVDLKDRFRTCCPVYYGRRARDSVAPLERIAIVQETEVNPEIVSQEHDNDSLAAAARRRRRTHTDRKSAADLSSLGITSFFLHTRRRQRRPFTSIEDAAILEGFRRHGPQWNLIRNDLSLALSGRSRTDLRDRFRNRYPELFRKSRDKGFTAVQAGDAVSKLYAETGVLPESMAAGMADADGIEQTLRNAQSDHPFIQVVLDLPQSLSGADLKNGGSLSTSPISPTSTSSASSSTSSSMSLSAVSTSSASSLSSSYSNSSMTLGAKIPVSALISPTAVEPGRGLESAVLGPLSGPSAVLSGSVSANAHRASLKYLLSPSGQVMRKDSRSEIEIDPTNNLATSLVLPHFHAHQQHQHQQHQPYAQAQQLQAHHQYLQPEPVDCVSTPNGDGSKQANGLVFSPRMYACAGSGPAAMTGRMVQRVPVWNLIHQ